MAKDAVQTQTIYSIPTESRDITRAFWSSVALMLVCIFVSLFVATQYMAAHYGYDESIGTPIWRFGGGGIYNPLMAIWWCAKYYRADVHPAVRGVATHGLVILMIGGVISLISMASLLGYMRKKDKNQRNDLHGSAHWATSQEIMQSGLMPTKENIGGALLGRVQITNEKKKSRTFICAIKARSIFLYLLQRVRVKAWASSCRRC